MTRWKITGLIATLIIILSIPAYMLKEKYFRRLPAPRPVATFVGNKKCMDCHRAHYGTIIDEGRKRSPDAHQKLVKLAADPLYPAIVRSAALSLLAAYPGKETSRAYELALMDDEALIRRTAVDHVNVSDLKRQTALLTSMLYDPVKSVRIEAARRMTEIADPRLNDAQKKVFQASLTDYQKSMEYSADFAFGRYNLANLYVALEQLQKAVESYQAAIKIDNLFYPAKVNLAMLYNQKGKNDKAEILLREVAASHPELVEVQYSLGLLLAEEKKYAEAAKYLERAVSGMPTIARIHYNLGLLLQHLRQDSDAETSLLKAQELEPDNLDYLYALADFYLKRNKLKKARSIAQEMVARHPTQRIGRDMLNIIEKDLETLSN